MTTATAEQVAKTSALISTHGGAVVCEWFKYLDTLRRVGRINMFGAGPLVRSRFALDRQTANAALGAWMESYSEEAAEVRIEQNSIDKMTGDDTSAETPDLQAIAGKLICADDIDRVYSGIDGKCCCGCAGRYWPERDYAHPETDERAYPRTRATASQIRKIVFIINCAIARQDASLDMDDAYASCVIPNSDPDKRGRLYIAYYKNDKVSSSDTQKKGGN